jgi:hypothetical protein
MARPAAFHHHQQQQQQQLAAVLLAALTVILAALPPGTSAVTCGQVAGYLAPCISYATGNGGGAPPEACCSGVRSLDAAARDTADRQAACRCLKQITGSMPALKPDIVAGIPGKCGVHIPYPISRSTDCDK